MATTETEPNAPPPEAPPQGAERELTLETDLRHSLWHKVKRGLGMWWSGETSLRRVVNAGLCHWSLRRRSPKVLGKPFFLMIETTSACNLRCPLCPTGRGTLGRKPEFLKLDLFKKCIDELGSSLIEVNVANYGEPMLHRDLCEMVAYAKAAGTKVVMASNAHFMDPESCRRLIDSGLDGVYISFDAVDQDAYEKYRVRGDFATVVEGTKTLLATRREMGRTNPFVEAQFLVMQHNEEQIDAFRALADELGVDRRIVKPVSFNVADWDDADTRSTFGDFIPADEAYRVYRREGDRWAWKKDELSFCTAAWRSMVVLADGSIVPCCRDPRGVYTMGHVSDGVLEVWNGPKFQAFRRGMVERRDKMAICKICPGE